MTRSRSGPDGASRPASARGAWPASGSTGSAGRAARRAGGCRGARARARRRSREPGWASASTLLTMAPAIGTPRRSKSAALRTISSIGRPDASLADDERRRPQRAAHVGIGEPDDGADAGVSGALDEQDVVAREGRVRGAGCARRGPPRPRPDERLGEAARDVDRAHHRVGVGQAERRAHEDGVLVGRRAAHEGVALADGLDEARCAARAP